MRKSLSTVLVGCAFTLSPAWSVGQAHGSLGRYAERLAVEQSTRAEVPFAHGPDLTVDGIDDSRITGDWQELVISGTLAMTVRNAGDLAVEDEFYVTVFQDLDRDGAPDPALDAILAVVRQSSLPPLEGATLTVPISTTVPFRDSPISVYVDSTNVVAEFSELNNLGSTGWLCRAPQDGDTLAPDLTVSRILVVFSPDRATVELSARVGNGGAALAGSGVPVEFTAGPFVGRTETVMTLAPGEFETVRTLGPFPRHYVGMVSASLGRTPGYPGDCDLANDSHSTWVDLRPHAELLYLPRLPTLGGYEPSALPLGPSVVVRQGEL